MADWLDAEAHADRALELYERGRWAEAEAELRKALALNPDHADWHYSLGLTLEAAGRDADALIAFERAIQLAPGDIEPLVAAGVVANRIGRFERALNCLNEAIRIDPGCEPSYPHKMEAHMRLGDHDETETTFYLAQQALAEPSASCLAVMAESLFQRKEYDRAGWCLREALRLEPSMPRLRARLGAVFAATGRPQRALQMYLRDLRDDPGSIDTLLDYGELLVNLGRLPEAGEKFRRVLELEPANVDAHYLLGQTAMKNQRYEQAHLEFELVMKLDPGYPAIRLALAEALLRRHRVEEARRYLIEEIETAREADPGGQPASDNPARVGALLLEADLPVEAERMLLQALEKEGQSLDLIRRLALARFRSGDLSGGVAASRRALRFDPACVASMHNLALAALQEGRLDVAAGWVRRGLKVDRHDDGLRRLRVRVWTAWIARACRGLIGRR